MKIFALLALMLLFFTGNQLSSTLTTTEKLSPTPQKKVQDSLMGLPDFMRLSPEWALEKLENMTLEEKIAQSFMIAVVPKQGEANIAKAENLIKKYKIGGIITFQGTVAQTKKAINRLQSASTIPLLVGMDAEWGSSMRLSDGERFPYEITMGAANNVEDTRIISRAMAKEMNDLGVQISFSPVVDVNTNPNNPIIGFRAFSSNPVVVAKHTQAMVKGMQDFHVLTSLKHFPGHGDTKVDSHKSLPVIHKSVKELNRVDWLPYKYGRLAGASAVMVSHLDVPALDSTGLPASLSPKIIKDYLKGKLKFKGLVISDALNMKGVTNYYGDVDIVKRAYMAGNDILLYPLKIEASIDTIVNAVKRGEIPMEVVNKKALKILRAKYYAEIHHYKDTAQLNQEKVDFAKMQVYEKALTVIKDDSVIPVQNAGAKNLILNIGGDGSSFTKMAKIYANADVSNVKTAIDAWAIHKFDFKNYDHIFINLLTDHEWPYSDFGYPKGWRELLKDMPQQPQVYVTFFGNPYAIKEKDMFTNVDAVILAFQNSKIGQNRAAQLIFGGFQATSKLNVSLSIDYQEGDGIVTPKASRLKFTVPMELGVSDSAFYKIDSIALDGIKQGAYPSCQIVLAKDGKVVYRKAFGFYTYDDKHPVNNQTIYDMASLTKIFASTASLMYLNDHHKFSLNDSLGHYLNPLTHGTPYGGLNMRDIVTHQARLIPWIPFYVKTLKDGYPESELYAKKPTGNKTAIVAKNLYIDSNYEDSMYRIIVSKPLRRVKEYKYSDLGFYFAKRVIERQTGEQLEDFVQEKFYNPMGLTTLGYRPLERFKADRIAPTEKDDYFRHQLLQGYVHDMGAAMMNGVGGHAGLFADATDLAGFMQMLLNGGVYGGRRYLSDSIIKKYTDCQFCPKNRRGAGFDKPVLEGTFGPSSPLASEASFGHTGFTGTIAWADPTYGINYIFLSNRVYPTAKNWKITHMDIRTKIQGAFYKIVNH